MYLSRLFTQVIKITPDKHGRISNYFIKLCIILNVSCSGVQKCDYCNLNLFKDQVVATEQFNYHQSCYRKFINPNPDKINRKVKAKYATKIQKETDISAYILEVKQLLAMVGIDSIPDNVKINVLNEQESWDKNLIKFFDKNAGGHAIRRGKNNYEINIQEGYSLLMFKSILAHELVHIWQYAHGINMNSLNREGFAELGAELVFRMDTTGLGKTYLSGYRKNDYSIYGKGYRKMKAYLDQYGWEKFLEGITMYY